MLRLILLSICCLYSAQNVESSWAEEALARHLLNSTVYSRKVRPVLNYHDVLKITHALEITQLIKLDEKNQVITTSALLRVNWIDKYLTWDPTKFNGTKEINLDIKLIWFPKIELFNNADDSLDSVATPSVVVKHDGTVNALIPRILMSTCKIQVKDFPFDSQVCEIRFGSFQYDIDHMVIVPSQPRVDLSNFQAHAEWDLTQTHASIGSVRHGFSDKKEFSRVLYKIRLNRKPLYYIYNFIMPCLLIATITVLLFLIPPQTGERMAVGVTILLSLAVFFLLLEQKMPETSDSVPLIGKYFACTIAEVSIAVASICLVLTLHHHEPNEIPKWMKKYILGYVAKICFIKTTHCNSISSKEESGTEGVNAHNLGGNQKQEIALLLSRKYADIWRRNIAILKKERQDQELVEACENEAEIAQTVEEAKASKTPGPNSPETMTTEAGDSDEEEKYWSEIEKQYRPKTRNGINDTSKTSTSITNEDTDPEVEVIEHGQEANSTGLRRRTQVQEHIECAEAIQVENACANNFTENEVIKDKVARNTVERTNSRSCVTTTCGTIMNGIQGQLRRIQEEDTAQSLDILAAAIQKEKRENEMRDQWRLVAKVVNYFCMWLFIIATIITFFTCFGPVMLSRETRTL